MAVCPPAASLPKLLAAVMCVWLVVFPDAHLPRAQANSVLVQVLRKNQISVKSVQQRRLTDWLPQVAAGHTCYCMMWFLKKEHSLLLNASYWQNTPCIKEEKKKREKF